MTYDAVCNSASILTYVGRTYNIAVNPPELQTLGIA